jgi:predicted RNA binding protein YcfA (HicA-like mRNA interferase family)
MKLPRDLSGAELIRVLCRKFDYAKLGQEGSHVILHTDKPRSHRLAVPNHNPLRVGTLTGILKAVSAAKMISVEAILQELP